MSKKDETKVKKPRPATKGGTEPGKKPPPGFP